MVRIQRQRKSGWLAIELSVALALLAFALLPLGYTFVHEAKLCRAYYYRAAAMGLVDSELEVLAAGDYRRFPQGIHDYPLDAAAARNLPGRFIFIVNENRLRLEWRPERDGVGGVVAREVRIQ